MLMYLPPCLLLHSFCVQGALVRTASIADSRRLAHGSRTEVSRCWGRSNRLRMRGSSMIWLGRGRRLGVAGFLTAAALGVGLLLVGCKLLPCLPPFPQVQRVLELEHRRLRGTLWGA